MKITSVRYSFATNSSSSHSIITGVPSWSKLYKDEIAEKYEPNKQLSYGEYTDIDDLSDIVAYSLYTNIISNLDLGIYGFDVPINVAHIEMQALARGFSEPLLKIIRKTGQKMDDLYVDDDNCSALSMAESLNLKYEDAFWNFVYTVTNVCD